MYLGDGDCKAFTAVKEEIAKLDEPWEITKLECVNHVAKRMYYHLSKRKEELKKTIVNPDGKTKGIGNRNHLTNDAMKKIQSYYGWIIYRSKGDAETMKQKILAMCDHLGSSDDNPMHTKCDIEYCKYLKAKKEGKEKEYKHQGDKHFHLPWYIMREIKEVFEKMSSIDLLKKCEHGKTQNVNECANSTVWNMLSKNGFANRYLVELVTSMATCMYN